MGKVIVNQVILRNNQDEILKNAGVVEIVRETTLDMIADTGARAIGLPLSIIEKLGLPEMKTVKVTLSDGSQREATLYGNLRIRIGDRSDIFSCIGKPEKAPCLLGQIVMEVLDFVVDCPNQRLIPNPEAPEGFMLYEDYSFDTEK